MVAGAGTLTLQKDNLVVKQKKEVEADELNSFLPQVFTGVIAAAHFHIGVVYTEDPSAGVAHVGCPLEIHHISRARARDVEIALTVTGIETCLGREHRGGTHRKKTAELELWSPHPHRGKFCLCRSNRAILPVLRFLPDPLGFLRCWRAFP